MNLIKKNRKEKKKERKKKKKRRKRRNTNRRTTNLNQREFIPIIYICLFLELVGEREREREIFKSAGYNVKIY